MQGQASTLAFLRGGTASWPGESVFNGNHYETIHLTFFQISRGGTDGDPANHTAAFSHWISHRQVNALPFLLRFRLLSTNNHTFFWWLRWMRGVEMENRRKLSPESESKERRIDGIGKGIVCEFVHNVPQCDGRKTEELLD